MHYYIVLLTLLLLTPGCQRKATIDPHRYARPQQEQPAGPVTQPPPANEEVAEAPLPEKPLEPAKPAPAPEPAPAPAPTHVREEVTYQVGSFAHPGNAENVKRRTEALGFISRVEVDESGATPQHRVIATYRGSDTQARELLATIHIMDAILLGGKADPTYEDTTPPPPPPPPAQQSGRALSYQVGAFSQEENARHLQEALERDGFTVVSEPVTNAQGATSYRVIATWYGTDEEARAKLLEHDINKPLLVRGGAPAQTPPPAPAPVAGPAPAPAPPPAAEPAAPTDNYRFQVGAFSDVENAEALQQRLKAGGFSAEIELYEESGAPKYRVIARKRGTVQGLRDALARMGVMNPILVGN